jgi:hypothetical protein
MIVVQETTWSVEQHGAVGLARGAHTVLFATPRSLDRNELLLFFLCHSIFILRPLPVEVHSDGLNLR